MFVIYLTEDTELIEHIVQIADGIYGEYEPLDFRDHVEFINKLYKEPPKVLLPPTDIQQNWEERRKKLDEAEEVPDEHSLGLQSEKIKYEPGLKEIVKINIAIKTLQLLGQVLRNFPGSLRKGVKLSIASSSYLLGLRTMKAVLRSIEANLEEFRRHIADLIKEHRPVTSERELEQTTDDAVIWVSRCCTYGLIKRVSYAVGHQILEETYKAVLEAGARRTSFRMIDLSVRLDHFTTFPTNLIEEMWDNLKKNYFAGTVLRDMVASHLYLFPVDFRTRQRMGQILDIETTTPRFVANPSKKLRLRR
jgi:hypothetical protein